MASDTSKTEPPAEEAADDGGAEQIPPNAELLRKRVRSAIVAGREKVGLSRKDMALELDWSQSKVMRIEQGTVPVSPSDVRAALSLFGAEEKEIGEAVKLAIDAKEARSWSKYEDILSAEYRDLIGQESAAASILKYEPGLVPGMFQTEDYARSLFHAFDVPTDRATRLTEVRMQRQELLEYESGPEMLFLVGEIALVRRVGTEQVMRKQIERLIQLSGHPRVSLGLVPFSAGAHEGMGIPFTILQFADLPLADILYLEDAMRKTSAHENGELVQQHLRTFDVIERLVRESGEFKVHAERILTEFYGSAQ